MKCLYAYESVSKEERSSADDKLLAIKEVRESMRHQRNDLHSSATQTAHRRANLSGVVNAGRAWPRMYGFNPK